MINGFFVAFIVLIVNCTKQAVWSGRLTTFWHLRDRNESWNQPANQSIMKKIISCSPRWKTEIVKNSFSSKRSCCSVQFLFYCCSVYEAVFGPLCWYTVCGHVQTAVTSVMSLRFLFEITDIFIAENLIRACSIGIIGDITNRSKANPGPIFSGIRKCDVETLKLPAHIHWKWMWRHSRG